MKNKLALADCKDVLLKLSLIATMFLSPEISLARKANAAGGFYTVYRYDVAAKGSCVPDHDSTPKEILRRNGIKYSGNPSEQEVAALAKGIAQVENLLGDPLPIPWRQNYNFITATGKWNQGATSINVRRPKGSPKGTNVGRMMHELGHKVGNSGVYQKYQSFTGRTRCRITGYAASKFNEEFAEVFEAYVVYPDLLEQKCPKAFEFMSKKLFPNTNHKISSCDRNSDDQNPETPSVVPLPIPRPSDLGNVAEVETDEDAVITPDNGDDEDDDDDVVEASPSPEENSLPVARIPIPTPRPSRGAK
nr:hypothetical protein [uncultured Bdellovibrio sp.]